MCVKASKLLLTFGKVIPHPRKTSVMITLVRTKARSAMPAVWSSPVRERVGCRGPLGSSRWRRRSPRAADQGSSSPVESSAGNLEASALLPSGGSQGIAPSQGGKLSSQSRNLAPRGPLLRLWLLLFLAACGILVPQPGIEFGPRQRKRQVSNTRLPGISPLIYFYLTNTNKAFGLPWWLRGKESTCQCRRQQGARVQSLGQEDALEKETATQSSILAWKSPRQRSHGVTKSRTRLSD